jgi:hypothetical protein
MAFAQFRQPQLRWVGTALNAEKTVDGYYESLPSDYSGSTKKYPIIIYLHGDESVEKGRTEVQENGLPKYILDGRFPETFKVKGQDYSFIVVAPHYTSKLLPTEDLSQAINKLIATYRVDPGRIYLTGMSRGSAYTWQYAGASAENAARLAAIVPVSNALQDPKKAYAEVIGDADLAVWATHNDEDYLVPASYTTSYVEWVNERKPQPRAELTLLESKDHEGWTQTFDPDFKRKGRNIYEWMLQYTRTLQIPVPVKLAAYKASQLAPGQVTITWTTASETNNEAFTLERSGEETNFTKIATLPAAGQAHTYTYIDKAPLPGNNFYRLSQTDTDGSTTYFPVLKVSITENNRPVLALHPNVITNSTLLQLTQEERGPVLFSVFNTGGVLVQQWRVQKETATWQQTVSFPALPSGNYVLQAQGKTFRHTQQFVKQ